MTYARKVDANHGTVKRAFEKAGCSVADLSRLGGGILDLLVAIPGVNAIVEVKPESKNLRGDKQKNFYRDWKGQKYIARNVDDVIDIVTEMGTMARKLRT